MRKKYKIYTLDYLINTPDFEDGDLYYLFETPSLTYSLIMAMFKIAGYKESEKEIMKIIKQPNWMYTRYFSDKQREGFENNLTTIFKKLYWSSPLEAESRAQFWYINYGFNNSKVKKNKKITKLCE